MRPVRRELDVRDARLCGHLHGGLGAVADLLQRNRVDAGAGKAGGAVWTVGLRIHAGASEPVHRLRELGDRRIGPRLGQRDHLLVRAEQRLRQRLGVERVDDRLRRQHVSGRVGCGGHLRLHPGPAVKENRRENQGEQDEDVHEAAVGHESLLTADCNPSRQASCALDRKMSWAGCEADRRAATARRWRGPGANRPNRHVCGATSAGASRRMAPSGPTSNARRFSDIAMPVPSAFTRGFFQRPEIEEAIASARHPSGP